MIQVNDVVVINGKTAKVVKIQSPEQSKYQKAIISQGGAEYSVNLNDLKPRGSNNGRN